MPYESRDLLALTAFVAQQSRGDADRGRRATRSSRPFVEKGRELFMQRQGQLNLACTNCHDDNWDKRLAGSADHARHIRPAIRSTGWNGNRWARCSGACAACITGIRAQAYDYGAPELVELELYLMSRARGMPMETPAVRP